MMTFIKNECTKVKSEKFIIIVCLLSLIPFTMNIANFFINSKDLSLIGGFYFRFYNQNFMIIPIAMGIIGSSIFYIEFKNHTLLNWLSYSGNKYKLFFSKLLVSLLYCLFLYAINLTLLLAFYLIQGRPLRDLMLIFVSFTLFNILLIIFMIPLSITAVIITKNYIVSIVLSIGIAMVSMILMPAPFANLIPTTLSYRLGLATIDSSIGFDSPNSVIIGIIVLIVVSLLLIILGSRNLKIK
ncbi:ABC transporter permease [Staphylococcus felis]|uniref:ABC transporter permease n=1 Tax=Staphylococcus felis TaxID=46127 RepID=UPI003966F9C7